MSRSGYSYDIEDVWALIRYRGQVASALRGKRGQVFLRELLAALDAMPEKRLIRNYLIDDQGCVCTLGAIGAKRGYVLEDLDPCDYEDLAQRFGVAEQVIREVENWNDEWDDTPEQRWTRMRAWVAQLIVPRPDELVPIERGHE